MTKMQLGVKANMPCSSADPLPGAGDEQWEDNGDGTSCKISFMDMNESDCQGDLHTRTCSEMYDVLMLHFDMESYTCDQTIDENPLTYGEYLTGLGCCSSIGDNKYSLSRF